MGFGESRSTCPARPLTVTTAISMDKMRWKPLLGLGPWPRGERCPEWGKTSKRSVARPGAAQGAPKHRGALKGQQEERLDPNTEGPWTKHQTDHVWAPGSCAQSLYKLPKLDQNQIVGCLELLDMLGEAA